MDPEDDALTRQIEAVLQRLERLGDRALGEALEELHLAHEEMRVQGEELQAQSEELATGRLALEAERQRYQDLFEFAPDGYLVTDSEGVIQDANAAGAALLAVQADFLKGRPLALCQRACNNPHLRASKIPHPSPS